MPQTLLPEMKPGMKLDSAPRVVISVEPDCTDSTTSSGALDSEENKGRLNIAPPERRASAPSSREPLDGRRSAKRLSVGSDLSQSSRSEKHCKSPRGKTPRHKSTKAFLTVSDGSDSSQESTKKRVRSASDGREKRPRRSLSSRRHGAGQGSQRISSSEEALAFRKASTFHEMHINEDKV